MKRVFIADDHAIVRAGIKQLLGICPGIALAGEAESGHEVIAKLDQLESCDLLLVDMTMPGPCRGELIRLVKARLPDLPIVVFSMHNAKTVIAEAIDAGATEYVTKDSDPEILIQTLFRVLSLSV